MVLDQEGQEVGLVHQDPEVVHQGLPVEEVVGGHQEVPGQGAEPGQVVDPGIGSETGEHWYA